MARPVLKRDEFCLLRDLINKEVGLEFDDSAAYLFEQRLSDRVMALEQKSFGEYYKYLRFSSHGPNELELAFDLLTTGETYFFRQEYQLRAFQHELLPQIVKANAKTKRLAVWSAGCSTGEEVYTIAMLIEQSKLFADWDVRVIGSDLCKNRVSFARQGVYRGAAFRSLNADLRREYFIEREDGSHVVDRIKKLCFFGQLNLLEASRASVVGRADVIFCRNVLIYFDSRARRRVIDGLYERLAPGGHLLLGHTESLLNVTTAFELVHLQSDLVYQKPLTAERTGRRSP
jgi:chemotaxis protein methyltransferase CheR